MGQAISLAVREQIHHLRQQGNTLKSISEQVSTPLSTVKKLCRRFRQPATCGLQPAYANCGAKTASHLMPQRDEAIGQRREHPGWGAPRIRVELSRSAVGPCGQPAWASIRTLQRWYRSSGLYRPRRQGGSPPIGRSTAPHNIWEVDAKENLCLADGTRACYLTIGDEKTGAWLEAVVFPLSEGEPGACR